MGKSSDETKDTLLMNYELAVLLIPEQFRKEFQNRIIPKRLLTRDLLPLIYKAREYEVEPAIDYAKLYIAARFGIKGFGRKLILHGVYPETIYAELTRGILDD